ncbi:MULTISPECIES: type II secretion system F family protein [Limibacillus]|uniref:General secretion pathway protein F n=1 Tax=Limibacillus halophilus TaxID=1579333 RepID=A0A839SSE4_9PROT|nr:type II secretion system F family protein [Limibacillus halophilus]MBB3064704.1 general secretion pathway protein F [Limibacillus halophilus]
MPLFRYQAIDPTGALIKGEMEARDGGTVIQRLQDQGHMPVEAEQVLQPDSPRSGGLGLSLPFRRGRVKRQDVTLFTRELAMLLKAGVALERALAILSQDVGGASLGRLVQGLRRDITEGDSFSEALANNPRSFPPIFVNMVTAAEASGTLELVLDRLADYRERAERLRETVIGAMLYPAILITASIVSLILLLVLVVPQFEQIFENAGAALPLATRVVIGIARTLESQGLVMLLVLLGALLALNQALRLPGFHLWWDQNLLRLPLLGALLRQLLAARFCRTFGTLLANGVDLPLALELSRDVASNRHAVEVIDEVILAVRQGQGLAQPMHEADILPGMAVQMLRVGEETGNLAPTALHVADVYERKVEQSLRRLFTILEPALIIGVGLLIAGIIVSILLAVVSVNDLAF